MELASFIGSVGAALALGLVVGRKWGMVLYRDRVRRMVDAGVLRFDGKALDYVCEVARNARVGQRDDSTPGRPEGR